MAQKNPIFGVQTTKMHGGQLINPAHLLKTGGDEFSIVPFGNLNAEVYLPYSMKQVISSTISDAGSVLGFQDILGKGGRDKTFLFASTFDWISFSGTYRKAVWRFSVEDKLMAATGFQNNLIELINYGNSKFVGEELFLNLSVGEVHVRSLNFSWAQAVNNQLDIGFTGKLYSGRSWLTANTGLSLYTDESLNYIDLGVQGEGKVSLPITLRQLLGNDDLDMNVLNYIFGFRNPGIGVDLGATYYLNQQVEISASVSDIGFIFWNRNTTTFETDEDYRWEGIDLSGRLIFDELGSLRESSTIVSFRDSFLNQLIVPDDNPYLTFSPVTFNAGATWFYSQNIGFGAYVQGLFFSNYIKSNIGLINTLKLGSRFEFISGFAFSNLSFFNIPAGIVFNGRRINASVSVTNMLGLLAPASSKNFGGSFNFAYRIKSEKPERIITPKEYPFYQKKIK